MSDDAKRHGALTPDSARPDSAPPDGTAPDGTAPDGTAPDGTAPDGTVPDGTAPDGTAPDGTVSDAVVPPRPPLPRPPLPRPPVPSAAPSDQPQQHPVPPVPIPPAAVPPTPPQAFGAEPTRDVPPRLFPPTPPGQQPPQQPGPLPQTGPPSSDVLPPQTAQPWDQGRLPTQPYAMQAAPGRWPGVQQHPGTPYADDGRRPPVAGSVGQPYPSPPPRRRGAPAWLLAIAGVVAVALVGVGIVVAVLLAQPRDVIADPTRTPSAEPSDQPTARPTPSTKPTQERRPTPSVAPSGGTGGSPPPGYEPVSGDYALNQVAPFAGGPFWNLPTPSGWAKHVSDEAGWQAFSNDALDCSWKSYQGVAETEVDQESDFPATDAFQDYVVYDVFLDGVPGAQVVQTERTSAWVPADQDGWVELFHDEFTYPGEDGVERTLVVLQRTFSATEIAAVMVLDCPTSSFTATPTLRDDTVWTAGLVTW